MKKGEFVGEVKAKYPAYKDVPDDELFIEFSKHFPLYIQNDEELKKEFLDLANQNEAFGSDVVKLSPEKAYNLITSIPEYKPPKSEYLEFGKHDPDVDWGEAGSAAVSYLGNMVAEGFSWDEDANPIGTVAEGAAQGTRALYGMLGESTDPNSVFFKGRALMSSLLNPTGGDDAGYNQWLAARDFAQQTLRYEEGKDQMLPDSIPVNRKAAVALGLGLDPSLFVSFGGGTIGKLATKGAAATLRGAGKTAKSVGKAVAMPMEKGMTAASEAITKAVPGVPEQTVRGTAIAATGMGAVATPVGQTVGSVYGAAKGAETLGDIALGVGEQMGKQPTRLGVFAGMAADPTKSKLTRGVSRAASVLGGDTALTAAGAATRGAFEGGVVGAGLGYGTAREQGAAGGLAGGAAFGVVGGTTGAAFRSLSGIQRKRAIGADFGRFLAETGKRSEAEALAVREYVGGDLTQIDSLNKAAEIMDLHDFAKGSSGEDVIVTFLNNKDFKDKVGGQKARGAEVIKGDRPEVVINTGWTNKDIVDGRRPLQGHTMAHEVFHAVGQLDGMGAYKGRLKDAIMGVRGSGDEVLRPGLLNESQLRDLATQYARKLNKQSRGEWIENWRDNTIEELSAEAFATLITGSKPDALLAGKGFDTLTRRALDRLILADAESRVGMMRNAVTRAFGVEFDPVVKEPTDSILFEGEKGNPLRNHSPAVNAILRDMVRAKRAVADHHALDNKLVSKNLVRTRGLSNKEMAKFQEQFKDNPMSELFTVDKKGKVKMVKGSEAGAIERETSNKIVDAIESAVDTGDALHVRKQVGADGKVEYSGLKFSKEQMDAINKTDIHPRIKEFLNLMQESLGDGRLFDTEYWAATRRDRNGQPVYASLKATRRNVVPYSMNISREGNFYARALDITALDKKFRQWKNRNTEWIRHWDNPTKFYEDAMKYLQNLASGDRVESAKLFGETKRNILNEFIGARGRTGLNPLALEKMAEKEFLIRSFRLDRIASMHLDNSQKRFPFSEEVYRLNQANFLPESEAPRNLVNLLMKGQPGAIAPERVVINKSNIHFMAELVDPGYIDGGAIDGKTAFSMGADRMKAGEDYITRSGKAIELRGGTDHPDLADNKGIVAWAVEGGPIAAQIDAGIKQTDGIGLVTLMTEESVIGNKTFGEIMLEEIAYDLANNKEYKKAFKERIKAANSAALKTLVGVRITNITERNKKLPVKERLSKEQIKKKAVKDVGDKKVVNSFDHLKKIYKDLTFEVRGAIWKQLGHVNNKRGSFKDNPAIFWKDVVYNEETGTGVIDRRDAEGYRVGDITKVIQFDKENPISTYDETGTPPHTAYQFPVKGHSLGNVKGRVNILDLLGPLLDSVRGGKYALGDKRFAHKSVSAFLRTNQLTNPDIQPTLTSESLNPAAYSDLLRFKTKAKVKPESFGKGEKPKPQSGTTPERVYAELESRRKINEELGGKYPKGVYLPEKVGPETIRSVDELAAAAMSERTWRTWYQRYNKQLNTVFGAAGAKTFEKVLGATSQATGVAGNVTLALRAYTQMITGQPFEGFLEGVVKNLERIKRDEVVQGQKIGEFAKATTGDSSGVAIDRHVARIIYGRKSLQQGSTPSAAQVRKGKRLVGEVAKKLGWKPREVQAALWAAQIELDARAKGVEPKKESYDTYLGEEYRTKRGKTPVKEIIRVAREIERGNAELISSTLGSKGSGSKSRPDRSGFVARERGNEQTVKFLPEKADADYAAATRKDDTAGAQRIVDQAAKAAGFGLEKFWHGGTMRLGNEPPYNVPRDPSKGFWLAKEKSAAEGYSPSWKKGSVDPYYVKMADPFYPANLPKELERVPFWVRDWVDQWRTDWTRRDDVGWGDLTDKQVFDLIRTTNLIDYDGNISRWQDFIKEVGKHHDGFRGFDSRHKSELVAVFKPEQLKSSDPVTHDAEGNIIPPSRRFDSSSEDVRFLPEELGPNTEQLAVALQEGAISRQQWDVAVELMRPIADRVTLPAEDNVILSQENLAKLEATMKKDQLPLIGEAEKLPEGFDVALRIDIPTYNKSLMMMAEGQLDAPVYAITVHNKADTKSKLGKVIGYDVFSRILEPKFHITSQKIGMKIGTGERNKTTMATAEGKLVKSRELPSMEGWTQVGMNPKRHGYFYDRATGKAVKGGAEAISYGNTVFVRKPRFFTETERLDLFSYLPEKVGDSEMRTTEEGYKSIKRDNKIRVYTPKGKLIGVASSAKVANQLYRRHIKSNESRTNNLRQ